MREYMTQIRQCLLFERIDDEDLLKTLNCLKAQILTCEKGKVIFHQGDQPKYFGVLLSGSIHVTVNHLSGEQSIIGPIDVGDLFCETCVCAGEETIPSSFIAACDSVVMILDHARVITGCRNNGCLAHSLLVTNLMRSIARKNLILTQKLSIVTQRTTRDKLMGYLEIQRKQAGSDRFTIPFDRQTLADYLGVDRSALSAEISKLKKLNVIDCRKNEFEILPQPESWHQP